MKEKTLTLFTFIFIAMSISGFTYAHWGNTITIEGTADMTTIKMATMEDLAKISEALMKPVLYIQKTSAPPKKETTHVFYIMDNNTRYQYKTRTKPK